MAQIRSPADYLEGVYVSASDKKGGDVKQQFDLANQLLTTLRRMDERDDREAKRQALRRTSL